jgi:hypothetical protein
MYVDSFVAAPDFTKAAYACQAGDKKARKRTNLTLDPAKKQRGV